MLYLIEILHQTTTMISRMRDRGRCILSKFYIKPQHRLNHWRSRSVVSYRNSTSNHNCKERRLFRGQVVSYRNSTSNHNRSSPTTTAAWLYLIEILHQTTTTTAKTESNVGLYLIEILHQSTTVRFPLLVPVQLYLIEILHQTTTAFVEWLIRRGCILSKFYIKPQLMTRLL